MKCYDCPIKTEKRCPGEFAPRLCSKSEYRTLFEKTNKDELEHKTSSRFEESPSFGHRALAFGKAIVEHAGAGFPATDHETVEGRWVICRSCEHFDAGRTACRVCGCQLQIKIDWAEQKCPIGRW